MISYGIISATFAEVERLVDMMSGKEELIAQRKLFIRGKLKNSDIVLCICGVGKTNAAHGTAVLLDKFNTRQIYIIGIAGAYPSSGMEIGDIAIADREIYGDEGLSLGAEFKMMDTLKLPLAEVNGVEYYNEFPVHVPAELATYKHKGAFVTVSSCTGTRRRGLEIERSFGAICENMEGAAIAHVCLLNSVSVVEIRGISNIIEDRADQPLNKADIRTAIENVQGFFLDKVL
ncbi:MAG TPA: futalosine hydrolase [Dissulfurispiraceae bacterium]|nr:futalosine hydrolase [Dissulfurispiraceae bacterium]